MRSTPVVALLAVAVACSARAAPTVSARGAGTQQAVSVSRAKIYHSYREIARDATALVEIEPTGDRTIARVDEVYFDIVDVKVLSVLHGSVSGAQTLHIRQLAGRSDGPVLPENGHFVAFIEPFRFLVDGPSNGQYIVLGVGAGLLSEDSSNSLTRMDAQSPDLPEHITYEELRRVAASSDSDG